MVLAQRRVLLLAADDYEDMELLYPLFRLAEADPAVRAGRLAVEIMTWYCPPSTMSQPGRAVRLP